MAVLIAAFGFAFDITGGNYFSISFSNWGFIGLIAFTFFVLITIFREIDLLIKQRPQIIVKHPSYYNYAKLEVTNNGAKADFTATYRVIEGFPLPEICYMCWEPYNTLSRHINSNDTASILVAEISPDNKDSEYPELSINKGGLALFKVVNGKSVRFGAISPDTAEQIKLKERYPTMFPPIEPRLEDKCIIEITITSTPQLRKPFNKHKYLLKIEPRETDKILNFDEI